jgi:hypothetical protein
MKIEFLIPGSPNDAFFSQVAMFRLALDSLGGIYERSRLVLSLGGEDGTPVPAKWKPHLGRVELRRTPDEHSRRGGNCGSFRYELLDDCADLSILCDADTLLLRAFDPGVLEGFVRRPAVRGVIAHFPPPLMDNSGHDYSGHGQHWFWNFIAGRTVGKNMDFAHCYTLMTSQVPCPFYVNYGFVVGTPGLFRRLRDESTALLPKIRVLLDNYFADQIGLAVACAATGVPTEAMPMRYNFPNDPVADAMYPDELTSAVVIHFLRTRLFDRHRIFASPAAFEEFLGLPLVGSNRVLQHRVQEITGGTYPFA